MKRTFVVALLLCLAGGALLVFHQTTYISHESVLRIGKLAATVEQLHKVPLPLLIGWLASGMGVFLLGVVAFVKSR